MPFVQQVAYSGMAPDVSPGYAGFMSLAAGGHAINSDDAVYYIDLMKDAPRWATVIPRSADARITKPAATETDPLSLWRYSVDLAGAVPARFKDRPISKHYYFSSAWIRKPSSVYPLGVVLRLSITPGSALNEVVDGISIADTSKWLPADAFPSLSNRGRYVLNVPTVAQHPVTQDIYYANQSETRRFDATLFQWVDDVPIGMYWGYRGSLIDIKRNRWVALVDGAGCCASWQLQTRTTAQFGTPPAGGWSNHSGLVHDTDNDLYWAMNGDGKVYTIHPDSGTLTSMFQLPDPISGPCNRFAFFPTLGGIAYVTGGQDAIFIPTR